MACSLLIKKAKNTNAGMPKLQMKDIKKHILILQWENGIQVLKKQQKLKLLKLKIHLHLQEIPD